MDAGFQARPGIYPDLPNSAYHSSDGISKTGLCRLDRAPKAFRDFLDSPKSSKQSKSLQTGSIFHIAMEGAFDRDCVVGPEVKDKRQREWKEFVQAHPGKICVTPDEAALVTAMQKALIEFGPAGELLSRPGRFEVSYFWIDEETGLLCKCRPDFISADGQIVVDFKTCQDATESVFRRAAERYHYHVSAAMTVDGILTITGISPRYIFLAIEPQSPHLVAAYEATADDLALGRDFIRRNLSTLRRCMDNGAWPGLPEEIRALDVGRWRKRYETDDEQDFEMKPEAGVSGKWWE